MLSAAHVTVRRTQPVGWIASSCHGPSQLTSGTSLLHNYTCGPFLCCVPGTFLCRSRLTRRAAPHLYCFFFEIGGLLSSGLIQISSDGAPQFRSSATLRLHTDAPLDDLFDDDFRSSSSRSLTAANPRSSTTSMVHTRVFRGLRCSQWCLARVQTQSRA